MNATNTLSTIRKSLSYCTVRHLQNTARTIMFMYIVKNLKKSGTIVGIKEG